LEDKVKKLDCGWIKLCQQTVVKDRKHLDEELEKVLAKKGEGLMIKDPDSMYERFRSDKLLKIKVFDDSEAKVLGHLKGSGKNCFSLGAL